MNWLRTMTAVAAHDLAREVRRPIAAGAVLLFGVTAIVVLRLALAGDGTPRAEVLAGALWVLLIFAALLGTARAWAAEREDGSFDALMVAPASRSAVHAGKVLVAFVTTLALHSVLTGLYLVLFGAPPSGAAVAQLAAAVVLAAAGFACVGVLVSGIGMRARSRDLLGPAMYMPLAIPLVVVAVTLSLDAYGAANVDPAQLLLFLAAYDATFLVAGLAAFPELAVE